MSLTSAPPTEPVLAKKLSSSMTLLVWKLKTKRRMVLYKQTPSVRPSARPGIAVEDGMASMRNSKQFGAWLNLSGCGHSINLRVPLHSYCIQTALNKKQNGNGGRFVLSRRIACACMDGCREHSRRCAVPSIQLYAAAARAPKRYV